MSVVNQYFVFDGKKCKTDGMSKEQILNAIAEATGVTPSDVDEGFITTIKETNHERSIHLWKGTQAEYNALETHDSDTFYIIDDDATIDDLNAWLGLVAYNVDGLGERTTALEQTESVTIGRLNALESDTGWQEISRMKHDRTNGVIGYYRKLGKIAFVSIDYKPSDYHDPMPSNDVFTIPIQMDVAISNTTFDPEFPCIIVKNDASASRVASFITITGTTSDSTTLQVDDIEDAEYVMATFSFPTV